MLDTVRRVSPFDAARPRGAALLALALAATLLLSLAVGARDARAQFVPNPWATINACDPADDPGSVGVRVSVPNRRDAAQWVRIRIQFFDGTLGSWRVVRSGGDGGFTKLSEGGGRVFGGTTFTFTPPAAGRQVKLRGLVDVQWRSGRRVVSRTQITTHGNHRSSVDPLLAVSLPTCVISR
jgi:hypothetical protein